MVATQRTTLGGAAPGSSSSAARQRQHRIAELLQEDVLATEEQEELVSELEATAAAQARNWRRAWAALAGVLALLYAGLAYHQAAHPWGTRHHAALHGALPAWAVALGELLGAVCLGLSATALLLNLPQPDRHEGAAQRASEQRLHSAALAGSLALSLFWLAALARAAQVQKGALADQAQHAWLAALPLCGALAGRSVRRLAAASSGEAAQLRGQMYDFKKA